MVLAGSSSEADKHSCVVVGLATEFRADAVAVLHSKSDAFQIYSRCVDYITVRLPLFPVTIQTNL